MVMLEHALLEALSKWSQRTGNRVTLANANQPTIIAQLIAQETQLKAPTSQPIRKGKESRCRGIARRAWAGGGSHEPVRLLIFLLSALRDAAAAKRLFRQALSDPSHPQSWSCPVQISR